MIGAERFELGVAAATSSPTATTSAVAVNVPPTFLTAAKNCLAKK